MPYIPVDKRVEFEEDIDSLISKMDPHHGELNYVLSTIATRWLLHHTDGRPSYRDRQHVHGTLKAVADEYYRRALARYEDAAIAKNGDMPEYVLLDGPLPP